MSVLRGVRLGVAVLLLGGCAMSQNPLLDGSPARQGPVGDGACPATTTPDRPAVSLVRPRVPADRWPVFPAAMDDSAHAVVVMDPVGRTWLFDVCLNTWQLRAPTRTPPGPGSRLVHDAAKDLTLAMGVVGNDGGEVWAYSLDADTWSPVARYPSGLGDITDAVYDPDREVVWAWDDGTRSLWSFDPAKRSWELVDRPLDVPVPDAHSWQADERWPTLMSYDPARHLLVLAFADLDVPGSTWTFDPGTTAWVKGADEGPDLEFGWFEIGNEVAFDSEHSVTVATARGRVATYATGEPVWEYPRTATGDSDLDPYALVGSGPVARLLHTLVFDGVNDRVILLGGQAVSDDPTSEGPVSAGGAYSPVAVWAYDVGSARWSLLSTPPD